MKISVLAPLAFGLLLAAASAQAQLYKWVAPDGTVSYSDKPPPANATKVERKTYAGGGSSIDELPFELANAAKNNPVTLYCTQGQALCDQARKMLNDRGIPFSEKSVNSSEDQAQLIKLNGSVTMPALLVGKSKQLGYNESAWGGALTAAGYPTSNKMPKSFKNPSAEPLVAASAPAPAKQDAEQKPAAQAPQPANGTAPPGFHF